MNSSCKNGIVILNYNTAEDTFRCVDSLFLFLTNTDNLNIYIVDNCSPDGSGELIRQRYQKETKIKVLISDRNGGFSYGNNVGIRRALEDGCDNIFLLNSDIYLKNDILSAMSNVLQSDESIVAVGPSVLNSRGEEVQYARKPLTFCTHMMERLPFLNDRKVRCFNDIKENNFVFPGMSSGCCFGLRADFIRRNHLLDDHVFMYYEEDIIAHLICRDKKKACICREAEVVHNEASSTKTSVEGKASFERMYRWSSAFYVLKNYAGARRWQLRIVYLMDMFEWWLLSLGKKEYKARHQSFVRLMDDYYRG